MVFKGLIGAIAATGLAISPAIAAQQSAAPATEIVDADSQLFGDDDTGFVIPLLALVAVILGILTLIDDDDEQVPVSP
ncbi:MAG: hypothetical protein ACFBQW_05310 [Sphingomonadaceae bacterium]